MVDAPTVRSDSTLISKGVGISDMERCAAIARVTLGHAEILLSAAPPALLDEYRRRAAFVDRFELDSFGTYLLVAAGESSLEWPSLVVEQRYSPGPAAGFGAGLLYVPETDILLLGAGERLLAYHLREPSRLWEDHTECGFWRWSRHAGRVLMSAELELVAWSLEGARVWTMNVEPPWSFAVEAGTVTVDVMGRIERRDLATGEVVGQSDRSLPLP